LLCDRWQSVRCPVNSDLLKAVISFISDQMIKSKFTFDCWSVNMRYVEETRPCRTSVYPKSFNGRSQTNLNKYEGLQTERRHLQSSRRSEHWTLHEVCEARLRWYRHMSSREHTCIRCIMEAEVHGHHSQKYLRGGSMQWRKPLRCSTDGDAANRDQQIRQTHACDYSPLPYLHDGRVILKWDVAAIAKAHTNYGAISCTHTTSSNGGSHTAAETHYIQRQTFHNFDHTNVISLPCQVMLLLTYRHCLVLEAQQWVHTRLVSS